MFIRLCSPELFNQTLLFLRIHLNDGAFQVFPNHSSLLFDLPEIDPPLQLLAPVRHLNSFLTLRHFCLFSHSQNSLTSPSSFVFLPPHPHAALHDPAVRYRTVSLSSDKNQEFFSNPSFLSPYPWYRRSTARTLEQYAVDFSSSPHPFLCPCSSTI